MGISRFPQNALVLSLAPLTPVPRPFLQNVTNQSAAFLLCFPTSLESRFLSFPIPSLNSCFTPPPLAFAVVYSLPPNSVVMKNLKQSGWRRQGRRR